MNNNNYDNTEMPISVIIGRLRFPQTYGAPVMLQTLKALKDKIKMHDDEFLKNKENLLELLIQTIKEFKIDKLSLNSSEEFNCYKILNLLQQQ